MNEKEYQTINTNEEKYQQRMIEFKKETEYLLKDHFDIKEGPSVMNSRSSHTFTEFTHKFKKV